MKLSAAMIRKMKGFGWVQEKDDSGRGLWVKIGDDGAIQGFQGDSVWEQDLSSQATKKRLRLLRIEAPNFVAGLYIDENRGRVSSAAPILRWTLNKTEKEVIRYCISKRWKITTIE